MGDLVKFPGLAPNNSETGPGHHAIFCAECLSHNWRIGFDDKNSELVFRCAHCGMGPWQKADVIDEVDSGAC